MKRKRNIALALLAGTGLAAMAVGQIVISPGAGGLTMRDSNNGNAWAVNRLWSHAQLLENEVVTQKQAIADLEKKLKEQDEAFKKLEKRVRNMELRGK